VERDNNEVNRKAKPVALCSVLLTQYNSGDPNEYKMSGACSTYGEMEGVWWKTL
jgi:hypothetical protein